jgi:hypothetical protein
MGVTGRVDAATSSGGGRAGHALAIFTASARSAHTLIALAYFTLRAAAALAVIQTMRGTTLALVGISTRAAHALFGSGIKVALGVASRGIGLAAVATLVQVTALGAFTIAAAITAAAVTAI